MPKLEPQIEFSVGIFSHERRKHLNFTVRRSGAILPRNPHLEPFTSWCSFAASLAPPHPCSRRANLTIRTCFLAQGWRSTSNSSILITRSSCLLALQVRPRSDLDGLGAAVVSAAGWCSRAASSRATSSPPPTTIGQLHFINVLVVHFSTGLWLARVRAVPLAVCLSVSRVASQRCGA